MKTQNTTSKNLSKVTKADLLLQLAVIGINVVEPEKVSKAQLAAMLEAKMREQAETAEEPTNTEAETAESAEEPAAEETAESAEETAESAEETDVMPTEFVVLLNILNDLGIKYVYSGRRVKTDLVMYCRRKGAVRAYMKKKSREYVREHDSKQYRGYVDIKLDSWADTLIRDLYR